MPKGGDPEAGPQGAGWDVADDSTHDPRAPDGRGLAVLRATGRFSETYFDAPEEVACKELLAAFGRMYSGAESAVQFVKLHRVERALPRFDVGHYRSIARLARIEAGLRRDGRRVYLAGDYRMDPSWSGAVGSGRRAARCAAADLA